MSNPLLLDLQETSPFSPIEIGLPTMGNFYYAEDEVLPKGIDPNSIWVKPLGIAQDMAVKDPFLAMSRRSTPLLIEAVTGITNPERLAVVDVEALLIACRIATYGPKYKIEHVCQNPGKVEDKLICKAARDNEPHTLPVNLYEHILRYAPYQDWERFEVDLPEVNQRVVLRPASYRAFLDRLKVDLEQSQIMDKYKDTEVVDFLTDDEMINAYRGILQSSTRMGIEHIIDSVFFVESVKREVKVGDRESIRAWIEVLPTNLTERIIERINEIRDEIVERSVLKYECTSCGFENKLILELDVDKLFSSGSRETPEPNTPVSESPAPIPEPEMPPEVMPESPPPEPSSPPTRRNVRPSSRTFTR